MSLPQTEPPAVSTVDEEHALISSARVEGTPVVDRSGHKLGVIHSLMLDKRSGQVAYAVLSSGGFLGIGAKVYRVPWEKLSYQAGAQAYRIDLRESQLRDAPALRLDEADRPTDHSFDERQHDYKRAIRYWDV
jgi:sporulation protein YlmC with PRC-barrel domain